MKFSAFASAARTAQFIEPGLQYLDLLEEVGGPKAEGLFGRFDERRRWLGNGTCHHLMNPQYAITGQDIHVPLLARAAHHPPGDAADIMRRICW